MNKKLLFLCSIPAILLACGLWAFGMVKPLETKFAPQPIIKPFHPSKVQFDVMLFSFQGDSLPDREWNEIIKQHMGNGRIRAIAYPDSETPILVPKSDLRAIRRVLAKEGIQMLQLSPELK